MVNLNEELMQQLFSNASKMKRDKRMETEAPVEVKDDLTEEESIKIYNEVLDVFVNHNISYRNACRLSVALSTAFLTGAVELYGDKE
jgi:hypothetical protein